MTTGAKKKSTTLLLTGFGPFPGVPDNVSARLVKELAQNVRADFGNALTSNAGPVNVHAAILPTEWQSAPSRLRALVKMINPNISLHFGVASGASGLRIETRAVNACLLEDDAAGLQPASSVLQPGSDPFRHATLPFAQIVTRLTEMGLPAYLSDDAGTYLCNAVLYHALQSERGTWMPERVGFIHVPDTLDGAPLTFDQALSGAMEIVRVCLGSM